MSVEPASPVGVLEPQPGHAKVDPILESTEMNRIVVGSGAPAALTKPALASASGLVTVSGPAALPRNQAHSA